MIRIKSDREVAQMREAGRIVAQVLSHLEESVAPGVSTRELDEQTETLIRELGGVPAFKGYRGYPANICASLNEEIVHGIPGDRKLEDGDILSVDVGVELNGYYGDAAVTFAIGKVSKEAKRLIQTCRETLAVAIDLLTPGRQLIDVCRAIQENVEAKGFGIIRDYVGHGIGHNMHEDPQVPNFVFDSRRENDVVLKRGMVLAIEPMICAGSEKVEVLKDGWTAVTRDRGLAAHFEHTVAVREGGGWILTEQ